jgi:uncharacterized peroxidase-related enzyme
MQSQENAMSHIRMIDENEAMGKLAAVYEQIRSERGNLANIHRIHSLFPEALQAHMDLYRVLMFQGDGELSRSDAELIATIVSIENSCDYCALHHGDALASICEKQDKASPLSSNHHEEWKLDERQETLLHFATKLTHSPGAIDEEDIQCLRDAGMGDRGILEVVLITSYFCFVNRIALGLGVTTSPEERMGFRY